MTKIKTVTLEKIGIHFTIWKCKIIQMSLDSNNPEDENALFGCEVKLWTVQWVALECYPPGKKIGSKRFWVTVFSDTNLGVWRSF